MIVVADTSPITALLHLHQLSLLKNLYGSILLPQAVADELQELKAFGYDITFLKKNKEFQVRSPSDPKLLQQFSSLLDKGEAEAITLAKELGADLLLIDEMLGKKVATAANIKCKGVIGVLIEAKNRRLITELKPLLDDLRQNLNFYVSDEIYHLALRKAGENP